MFRLSASAPRPGGVEALEQFFEAMPADNGMAFVVVTRLPRPRKHAGRDYRPRHQNAGLQRHGTASRSNRSRSCSAAQRDLDHRAGRLRLGTSPERADRERTPIDVFFNSLAEDQGEHAIGVVLSGGGSDGTLGLKAIKENGGLTVAQGSNLTRPRFAEMPSSAVAAGFVDLCCRSRISPNGSSAMCAIWGAFDAGTAGRRANLTFIACCANEPGMISVTTRTERFSAGSNAACRWSRRHNLEDYVERLQADPEEVGALFRDLLIGVTNFFRDPAAFRVLETWSYRGCSRTRTPTTRCASG